jgi:hypothetical protein
VIGSALQEGSSLKGWTTCSLESVNLVNRSGSSCTYRGCVTCSRKVDPDINRCPNAQCASDGIDLLFHLNVTLVDASGSISNVGLFGNVASTLISHSAREVAEMSEDDLLLLHESLMWTTLTIVWSCTAGALDVCRIHSPPDWNRECQELQRVIDCR